MTATEEALVDPLDDTSYFPTLDAGWPDDPEWPERPSEDAEEEITRDDGRVEVDDLVRRHGEWHEDEQGRRMLTRRGVIRIARAIRRAERRGLLILPRGA